MLIINDLELKMKNDRYFSENYVTRAYARQSYILHAATLRASALLRRRAAALHHIIVFDRARSLLHTCLERTKAIAQPNAKAHEVMTRVCEPTHLRSGHVVAEVAVTADEIASLQIDRKTILLEEVAREIETVEEETC